MRPVGRPLLIGLAKADYKRRPVGVQFIGLGQANKSLSSLSRPELYYIRNFCKNIIYKIE
jgi:hypothetical protein